MSVKFPSKLVLIGLLVALVAEPARGSMDDLESTVQQVGSQTLPYEAVRLRLTLRNVGANPSAGLTWLDESIVVVGIQPPGAEDYYAIRANVIKISETSVPAPHARSNERQAMILEPGEETAATFALSAEWGRKVKPLFPVPGRYLIKVGYSGPRGMDIIADPFALTVREPEGSDAAAYDMLRMHPKLAAALMSPIRPPGAEELPAIQEFVQQFPESSYANYSRFALARASLNGIRPSSQLSSQAREAAVTELKRVTRSEFAYRPNVLILLRRLLKDDAQRASIQGVLEREFGDSLEWLRERSSGSHP